MHTHQHDTSEKLGQVNFSVSCKPAARGQFNRATAMLHSFWYAESEKAYAGVAESDPACAMAYWGVAMSLFNQVWAPATAAELQRGRAAIEKAKSIGGRLSVKDYIAAMVAFYKDSTSFRIPPAPWLTRRSMERVTVVIRKTMSRGFFIAFHCSVPPMRPTRV